MLPAAAQRRRPALRAWPGATGSRTFPITGLRRAIAEHLQEAARRIPHFSYIEEIDVTALEELRAHLNETRAGADGAASDPAALPDAGNRQCSR